MDIKHPTAPCICCHTTLWNKMSAKQAFNDNKQGIVVTYLRCGGVVNNQIEKGLLLSEWIFLIGEYLAKLQARAWLSHTLCTPGQHTAKRRRKCTIQSRSCFFVSLVACFADINVWQGSVATYARCGGIFNMHLTANLPGNLPVKKYCKSVTIWQNYESVTPFLAHPVCIAIQY